MKYLLIICLFLAAPAISGQVFSLSDFYVFNGLVINPAFAGSQDALSTTLQYRDQWADFRDAPKSSILSAHAPVFNDRMGLGLLFTRNSFGIYTESSIMGNYAYRFNLGTGKLAFGLAIGMTSYHISWKELEAADPDDILLHDNPSLNLVPDFSIGTYYTANNFFAGISIPFFLKHKADGNSGKYKALNQYDAYDYFLTGGYFLSISSVLRLEPSMLLRYNNHTDLQGDFYLQAEAYSRIRAGTGFRTTGTVMGLLSFNVNRQLRISYSFGTDSGKAGSYRKGSHEIMIGYIFRYERNVMSPATI